MTEFPLVTLRGNTEQKVEDNLLVGSNVVKPFIDGGSFPDGGKEHSNGVGRRHNGTGNNVVSVQQRTSDGP